MKIIGHRGGAKIVPENSLKSLRVAKNLGIDGIEIDIRVTKDKELVVFHDETLARLSDSNKKISSLNLASIKKVQLKSRETIPTLDEFLKDRGNLPIMIEGKGNGWAVLLAKKLAKNPNNRGLSVISFNHVELGSFKNQSPGTKTYALSVYGQDAVSAARRLGFDGIGVFYLALFNPYLAWQIKTSKLEVNAYTIGGRFIAQLLNKIYPNISVTTNSPDRLKNKTNEFDKNMVGKIVKIEALNDKVRSFYFKSDQDFSYLAGQYVDIKPPGVDQSHWYTLSSSPSEETVFFTTIFLDQLSPFKQALLKLTPGDEIHFSEPFGDYVLPKNPQIPLIFIAGGIGITPVRSVIKHLSDTNDKRRVELFYCVKHEDDFLFEPILSDYPMNYVPFVSNPHDTWDGKVGRIEGKRVIELSELIDKEPMIFISGPQKLVEDLTDDLSKAVGRQRIVMDYFPGYLDIE